MLGALAVQPQGAWAAAPVAQTAPQAAGASVDARTPAAFVGTLREMGYDVSDPQEFGTGGTQFQFLLTVNGLKIQTSLGVCTNGVDCQMAVMITSFGKVPATADWQAKVNTKTGFSKVSINESGYLLVSYGFFPQGMTRVSLRHVMDTYFQGVATAAREAMVAGYIQAPSAPSAAAPVPKPK